MDETQVGAVFTEWLRQYQEDPESFDDRDLLDIPEEERPSYGVRCARHFLRISADLAAV